MDANGSVLHVQIITVCMCIRVVILAFLTGFRGDDACCLKP